MFEAGQRPAPQPLTSASNHLFEMMANNPNATRKVAAFGVQQAQKHPDVAKKVATSAYEHAAANPEATRQVANKTWETTQPTTTDYRQSSVRTLKSELETKLTVGYPPRSPRPVSCEPPPVQISSFDPYATDANRDRSWDQSAAVVSRSRSSHSFSGGKSPPKRPPPPKFGSVRKSPTMPAFDQQPVGPTDSN
jgi:hypothetical protein